MDFYSSGSDMVGSLSTSHVALWQSAIKFNKTSVDVITINELENQIGTQFDFVGILRDDIYIPLLLREDEQ